MMPFFYLILIISKGGPDEERTTTTLCADTATQHLDLNSVRKKSDLTFNHCIAIPLRTQSMAAFTARVQLEPN